MPVANRFTYGGVRVAQEQRGNDSCGFPVHAGHGVLVGAGREGFGAMSQPGADNLRCTPIQPVNLWPKAEEARWLSAV
jgi:hypothetical protein